MPSLFQEASKSRYASSESAIRRRSNKRGSLTSSYILEATESCIREIIHHIYTSGKQLARFSATTKYAPGTDLMSKCILTERKLIDKVLSVCISLAFQGLVLNIVCVGQHDRQCKRLEARNWAMFQKQISFTTNSKKWPPV